MNIEQIENEKRIGLNSLRDFFLDEWQGKVVSGIEEANKYLEFITKSMTEKSLLKKLRNGDFFITFIKDYSIGDKVANDFDNIKEISFRTIPVENGLGLVYFYINRDKGKVDSKFISAELEGLNRLLKGTTLNRSIAKAWMESRISDRIICVKELEVIFSNEKLKEAFLCYSPHFTRRDYENWKEEFKIDLKIRKGHRNLLARVVKSITHLMKTKKP